MLAEPDSVARQPPPSRRQEPSVLSHRANPSTIGDGTDLREIFNILRRRRNIVLGSILFVTIISTIVIFQMTPRYSAEAVVMLDTRKTQVVDIQAVVSGLSMDDGVLRSEVEVLKSPAIAERVVQRLQLVDSPIFNPSLRPASLWSTYNPFALLRTALENLTGGGPSDRPSADELKRRIELTAVGILSGRVSIGNDGRSYVLKVRTDLEDPKLAADVANAYVDSYFESQLDAKYEATRRANAWLNDRITDLKDKVNQSERAVQVYRDEHNLGEVKGATIKAQQLSEVSSQLVAAAADRAQKEANLRQMQEMLRGGGADAAAQVLASPLIQQLRTQETEVVRRQSEMATRYKPGHPAMVNIDAELRDLRTKINDEVGKIIRGLANEVASARTREESLRGSLKDLEQVAAQQDKADVGLRELEREAQANRTLYENFLGRFKQTSNQEDIQQADARLVSAATVPTGPSYPKKTLMMSAALGAAIIIGVAAALGVERLDNGFRTPDQIEALLGVPTLGLVPLVDGEASPVDIVVKHPTQPFSESIRTVRTVLRYSNIDNPPKIVLVTSSLPVEGKTVFAACLARSAARSGARVLLVECDLRRPSLSNHLGSQEIGLPGILTRLDETDDISGLVQMDPASGMHFVPAVGGASNPQDLLSSQHMRRFLDLARERYDLVVLDSPPVLAVSDAVVLSHIADTTIFLVRWETTPRQIVVGALKQFAANGGNLAGVVLSRVNVRKHSLYGYGDHAYYYGRYGDYYSGSSQST